MYVTARPDLQHNKVVAWLAQHNFPHGMVAFMDGFSKEPIRQKIQYLRHVQADVSRVQSLYITPRYNTELDITQSCCFVSFDLILYVTSTIFQL